MLQRLGVARRLEWRRLDHTYRLGGVCLDVPRDWHDYVRELGRLFPASAAGFDRLFADIRAIYDGMYATGSDNGGIPGLPTSVEAMLAFPREHPLEFQWLERPFDELVAQHIQEANARQVLAALTSYVSDGAEALTCAEMIPLFGYYFHGGFYPVGWPMSSSRRSRSEADKYGSRPAWRRSWSSMAAPAGSNSAMGDQCARGLSYRTRI